MVLRNGSALSDVAAGDLDADGNGPSTSQPIRVEELDHYDEDWVKPFPLKDGVRIRKGEKFSDYYILHEEIGEGKFGKVYRCVEKASGLVLAAKCIKIRKDTDFEKVEKEVNIMTQMRHKCIAQIYDAFATDANDVILIMEIVQGGELFDRVADDSYILTEMAVALIMFQICEAIRYIHSQNIIHLDLKPENIMCVSQTSNTIKLIDFGLAQWYDGSKDLMFMAGTPEFAAPEVIKYEPLDFHTDMWSLGVIAYILLSGQSPFLGETLAHTYCNVERGYWMFCEEFTENGISRDAKDFISRLLIVQKEKRMLPHECLKHPWIVNNRQRAMVNASRAVSPAAVGANHPLAVNKLRSYVKNKKFRRLVFGVLFVNSVMRMLQTLQRNKSTHGIQFVRNMLAAAEEQQHNQQQQQQWNGKEAESNLLLKAFTKKRRPPAPSSTPQQQEGMEAEAEKAVAKAVTNKMEVDADTVVVCGDDSVNEKLVEEKEQQQQQAETRTKRVVIVKKKVRVPGEKKKRSKSEVRRAAEQQRTRSSTEQTSSKKKRHEEEEIAGEEMRKGKKREEVEQDHHAEMMMELDMDNNKEAKKTARARPKIADLLSMNAKRERQEAKRENGEIWKAEMKEAVTKGMGKKDDAVTAVEAPTTKVDNTKQKGQMVTGLVAQRMDKLMEQGRMMDGHHQPQTNGVGGGGGAEGKKNSLVSSMLKRLEQQQQQQQQPNGAIVMPNKNAQQVALQLFNQSNNTASAAAAAPPPLFPATAMSKLKKQEKGEKEEVATTAKNVEKKTKNEAQATNNAGAIMNNNGWNWRDEVKRMEMEATAATARTPTEETKKKKLVKKVVKRKVRRRTADAADLTAAAAATTTKDVDNNEVCGTRSKKKANKNINEQAEAEEVAKENKAKLVKKKIVKVVRTKNDQREEMMEEEVEEKQERTTTERTALAIDERRTKATTGTAFVDQGGQKKTQMNSNSNKRLIALFNDKSNGNKPKAMLDTLNSDHNDGRRHKEQLANGVGAVRLKNGGGSNSLESREIVAARRKALLHHHHHHHHIRPETEEMDDEEDEHSLVGHDVFDFSLLRKKLQNRIMGLKDRDELATEAENRQKFELQKQQRELQTNLNIKRAMRKWVTMDKESRQQQTRTGAKGAATATERTAPEPIPEWAR